MIDEPTEKAARPAKKRGPKTEQGKRRSSMNSMKHGLYAKAEHTLEELEKSIGYTLEELRDALVRWYHPVGPVEQRLVARVALCLWRLSRSEAMEWRAEKRITSSHRTGSALDKILKYERTVDVHLHRALAALERRKRFNVPIPQNELPPRFPRA